MKKVLILIIITFLSLTLVAAKPTKKVFCGECKLEVTSYTINNEFKNFPCSKCISTQFLTYNCSCGNKIEQTILLDHENVVLTGVTYSDCHICGADNVIKEEHYKCSNGQWIKYNYTHNDCIATLRNITN